MDDRETVQDLMMRDPYPSIGGWIIALAGLVLFAGVMFGLDVVTEAGRSGNSGDSAAGWVIIGVTIVQAMFIAAVGSAVTMLRSIAMTNARIVVLLREAVGYQQGE